MKITFFINKTLKKDTLIILNFAKRFHMMNFAGMKLKFLWSMILPILFGLLIHSVFKNIFKLSYENSSFIILSGFLNWQFFSSTLSQGHQLLLNQRHEFKILKKNHLHYVFGFVFHRFLLQCFGLFLFSCFCWLIFDFNLLSPFYFIVYSFLIVLFTSGLVLYSSSLTSFHPDFKVLVDPILTALLWLSPVFYSISQSPESFKFIMQFNPLTCILENYRSICGLKPLSFLSFLYQICFSVALFILGILHFKKHLNEILKIL